jgi:hypothetical protein
MIKMTNIKNYTKKKTTSRSMSVTTVNVPQILSSVESLLVQHLTPEEVSNFTNTCKTFQSVMKKYTKTLFVGVTTSYFTESLERYREGLQLAMKTFRHFKIRDVKQRHFENDGMFRQSLPLHLENYIQSPTETQSAEIMKSTCIDRTSFLYRIRGCECTMMFEKDFKNNSERKFPNIKTQEGEVGYHFMKEDILLYIGVKNRLPKTMKKAFKKSLKLGNKSKEELLLIEKYGEEVLRQKRKNYSLGVLAESAANDILDDIQLKEGYKCVLGRTSRKHAAESLTSSIFHEKWDNVLPFLWTSKLCREVFPGIYRV